MRALILAATVATLTSTAAVSQQSPQSMPVQQTPGPMMTEGWTGSMMGRDMMPMMRMMDAAQHVEGRLAFLKTELKITEAQAQEWNAYAEAMRANAKQMGEIMTQMMSSGMMGQGMMTQGEGQTMRLPDRLNRAEQQMAAHLQMLEAIKEPTNRLYAILSDEQKQVADQLLGHIGMMGVM